jgi:putative transposase
MKLNKSKYDPKIHNRRSRRLKGYNYARAGLYFITIVCQNRIHRFGHIDNGEMILNDFGKVAHDEWVKLSDRFSSVELDAFQIMPDHMHGIINIVKATIPGDNPVGATLAVAQEDDDKGAGSYRARVNLALTGVNPAPTVSDIIGAYKSLVANGCLKIYKSKNELMGKFWQRDYYEHIIRNEKAYQNISLYIENNPQKWMIDKK